MSISLTSSYHSIKGVDCIYEHSNEIEENSYIARKLKEIIISLITQKQAFQVKFNKERQTFEEQDDQNKKLIKELEVQNERLQKKIKKLETELICKRLQTESTQKDSYLSNSQIEKLNHIIQYLQKKNQQLNIEIFQIKRNNEEDISDSISQKVPKIKQKINESYIIRKIDQYQEDLNNKKNNIYVKKLNRTSSNPTIKKGINIEDRNSSSRQTSKHIQQMIKGSLIHRQSGSSQNFHHASNKKILKIGSSRSRVEEPRKSKNMNPPVRLKKLSKRSIITDNIYAISQGNVKTSSRGTSKK